MHLTIEDLRRASRRRLPRAVFDFIDGAAEDERALRNNRDAFERLRLSPRVLVDVSDVDTSVDVLRQRITAPLVLGPTGLCGMARPRGEIAAGRAAVATGTRFVTSCMAAVPLEEIVRDAPGPHWFQIYIWRDRDLVRSLLDRSRASGYEVLVATVDTPVLGQRERDARNGATIPPKVTLRNALDVLRRPRWLYGMATGPRVEFANAAPPSSPGRPFALTQFVGEQFDPSATWRDLAWLRDVWPGPLVIKGVLRPDDAERAVETGVDGIIVSNHGGRQLDEAVAPLEVLPSIAAAVNGRAEVYLDGGIRRGSDIVKALALGARACFVGRPYLYGLGAAGQEGVERCVEILTAELRRTMALCGVTRAAAIGPDVLAGRLIQEDAGRR